LRHILFCSGWKEFRTYR